MIRTAKEKDLIEMLNIYNDEVLNGVATFDIDPKTLHEWREWLEEHQDPYIVLVYEIEGYVAGYASLSSYRKKQAFASCAELSIYVNKKYRNQHIASRLMESVLTYATNRGFHTIVSVITSGNQVSEHLHKKFGFEYCGTIKEVGYKMNQYLSIDNYQIILK